MTKKRLPTRRKIYRRVLNCEQHEIHDVDQVFVVQRSDEINLEIAPVILIIFLIEVGLVGV